jgi:4-alpha-glucanotransferase
MTDSTNKFPRASGILLHPTSLAGGHGVGDLGPAAHGFLDFLADAGQSIWQMLPLGPTGYGDSPYQCLSAFAGNPLLISLDLLRDEGLLTAEDLRGVPPASARVDYAAVQQFKQPRLELACRNFFSGGGSPDFVRFRASEARWLPAYTRFVACKEANDLMAWTRWRDTEEPDSDRMRFHEFCQYIFARQYAALRAAAARKGIRLMGDLPIYAAHDSADVWASPQLFELLENGEPAGMAGVPPDYFSATGQLWGNPTYRWDVMAEDGYAWWIERFRAAFQLFDCLRVDHFRGFQAYWRVPAGETTALHGEWVDGPGEQFFAAIENAIGPLPIVAENLGVITPQVEQIRHRFGFPGMAILQFAFGKDPQGPSFRPHNYPREIVAYTGTHDNDTVMGWWQSTGGDSTRTAADVEEEKRFACRYLGTDGREIHWDLIRALQASVADTVITPVQDLLGLGSEARMNMPSTLGGNWLWRVQPGRLTDEIARRLRELAESYDRLPPA